MGLTAALTSAISGLHVTQTGISVVSGNIAGATDKSYTKKSVVYGTLGSGASISAINRATNTALQGDFTNYTSIAGMTAAQNSYISRFNTLFGGSTKSPLLSTATEELVSAWQAVQINPSDSSAKLAVVDKANTLAANIKTLADAVENVDAQVKGDINDNIDQANKLLSDIDDLNKQVVLTHVQGQDITNLQDMRDAKLSKLAKYMDIKAVPRADGSLGIYTASGITLVDHSAGMLSYDGSANTITLNNITPLNGSGNSSLRAGSLLGLANLRDIHGTPPGMIQQLRDQLDTFANKLSATTDSSSGETQSLADAYNTNNTAGTTLFTPTSGSGARFHVAVDSGLLHGTTALNTSAAGEVVTALTAQDRNFTASSVNSNDTGLSLTGQDYTGMASGVTTWLAQKASSASSSSDIAEASRSHAETLVSSKLGVNMDDELANLQVLQNAYSASAHVLTVVNDLYEKLFAAVR